MMCCYILICFLTLICHSMGKTTEDLSLSDDKQITTLDSLLNDNQQVGDNNSTSSVKQVDDNNSASSGKQVDDNNSARFEKQDNEKDRSGQSRMLSLQKLFTTTTTVKPTVYDYWSFFTTPQRPLISYRDYPGKPGVATWKEISSTAVKDNQKDRKIEDPTAASVSSSAPRWPARYCFPAILILLNFYVIYDGRVGRNFGTFS